MRKNIYRVIEQRLDHVARMSKGSGDPMVKASYLPSNKDYKRIKSCQSNEKFDLTLTFE